MDHQSFINIYIKFLYNIKKEKQIELDEAQRELVTKTMTLCRKNDEIKRQNQRKIADQKATENQFYRQKEELEEKIKSLNEKLYQISSAQSRKKTEIIKKEDQIEKLKTKENLQMAEKEEEKQRFREAVKEKSCWRVKIEKQKSDIEKVQSQLQSLKTKLSGERQLSILEMKGLYK